MVGISVEAKCLALCKTDNVVTRRPDWSVTCCLPAVIGRTWQRVMTRRSEEDKCIVDWSMMYQDRMNIIKMHMIYLLFISIRSILSNAMYNFFNDLWSRNKNEFETKFIDTECITNYNKNFENSYFYSETKVILGSWKQSCFFSLYCKRKQTNMHHVR